MSWSLWILWKLKKQQAAISVWCGVRDHFKVCKHPPTHGSVERCVHKGIWIWIFSAATQLSRLLDLPFCCVFLRRTRGWGLFDWKLIFGRRPCRVWFPCRRYCVNGDWSQSIMLMVFFYVWKIRSAGDAKFKSTHFLNEGNPSAGGSTFLQVIESSPWYHQHERNTGRQLWSFGNLCILSFGGGRLYSGLWQGE